ncbi:cytochrome b6-f complex iron-sulfur subunit [Larkinella arboricola]|uniref:Cytochrome b6-f complex iron-sulfur subunit n=1 Tax=Larkinella arboricola TaxID=643671 RepID=A0A327X585_LARAB|nr:Rieske (2Fe-2S) protein [Larkinella arboricola]RAK02065.1 cytochrome b6-f complex iron-sulfur subunit [Larkinella arboricola]
METNQQQPIKRGEFLRSLGLSSAALMAFYCMGTLTSCSKGSDDPEPEPTPGNLDVTLDLTQPDFKALQTPGGYAYHEDILIARVKNGNYVALSKVCTHQSSTVFYRPATDDIFCATHGSEYTTAGVVKVPAESGQKNLTQYKTSVSGNNLRITG